MDTKRALVIAAASVMVACTQKENPVEERVPVALSYTTVQATETRAAQNLNENTFDSGEAITVRISNTGTNQWTDYRFTTADAGAMTASNPAPYYPAGSQNIDIVAYYPATAGTSFTVAPDQTADASYKASDLMFASVSNQAKQNEAVELAFSHKMSKINVNIATGTGIGNILGVSILNVQPTVSFNQATGEVSNASGPVTNITMSNNGAAIIPAQSIDGGLLSIVTDKGTATYNVSNKVFAAGHQYTINITVNIRSLGATNTITGWNGEGEVTVYPERPNIAGHDYVDMGEVTIDGVTKHLLWATCNVGAATPWEYGDYFAWGATVPFYLAGHSDESSGYCWANYPFMQNGQASWKFITKYTFEDGAKNAIWYDGDSFVGDGKTSFADYDYADDAARQRWGSSWHTPTVKEWRVLFDTDSYSWEWCDDYLGDGSGHKGMRVTRLNGPCEGNTIFLPAAECRVKGNDIDNLSYSSGQYWSSSLSEERSDYAYWVTFQEVQGASLGWNACRYYGYSVRPVTE